MQNIKQTQKRIIVWSIAAIIIAVGVFGAVKLADNSSSGQAASLTNAVTASDIAKGNADADVILVEYSDFQCPACGAYYPLVKELNNEFGERILFVYRHFPLTQIHANAELAARAAEAAGKQEKFWEMHDMLFENQSAWSGQRNAAEVFIGYARSLGIDIEKFRSDLDSQDIKEKVKNDYLGGLKSGVNATPTFFLNGTKIDNPRSYDEFRNLIEQAINAGS